jgi:hypothetical protein
MSALGAAVAKGAASLGGPQAAALVVAGGLVAGGLGGAWIGSGGPGQQQAVASGELAVYPCPEQGPALTTVKRGQKLLATGRSEDGSWLRIHYPSPGRSEAWVVAAPLTLAAAPDSLPVAECEPEYAAGEAEVAPDATLSAILNLSPSPAPTPSPTPVPNARPSLSNLRPSTRTISHDTGEYCPTAGKRVTFRVTAKDSIGVAGVVLFWREPGASSYAQVAMTRSAGSARSGTWQATLDTRTNGITEAGRLAYYAVATDTDGATRKIPTSGSSSITVEVCVNTGPAITSARSSSGNTIAWDPLGVGSCQTATNITAAVKDVDGVDSVRLFYRRPGSDSWSSKPMDNTTIAGKWYANLDTLGDKITITDPPTDGLRWYIKAVDDTGLSRQSKTFTITVKRCDSEADFGSSSSYPENLMCPGQTTTFYGSASDPDGINGSSAVFVYEYLRADGTQRTGKKQMTGGNDGRWYYQVNLTPGDAWSFQRSPMTFYIQTTDQYGGVSRGGSGKMTVTSC